MGAPGWFKWLASAPIFGGQQVAAKRGGRRAFGAADYNRLNASFSAHNTSINADLEAGLVTLRGRSRNMYANASLSKRAVKLAMRNIVGPNGFTLQSKAADFARDGTKTLDKAANEAIERHFRTWSRPAECTLAGRLSFPHLCRLVIGAVVRDGEAIVRRVRSRSFAYGYRLQLLDIDRLDHTYTALRIQNGNSVRMGVEITPDGVCVALYLLTYHPGDPRVGNGPPRRLRVSIDDVFHVFLDERPEQVRGYPWSHAILSRLQMLDGFSEAAVVAARVGAAKMGIFTTPDGNADDLADVGVDGTEEDGQPTTEADPGRFIVAPEGSQFSSFNPDYPHQFFDPFVKAITREIAVGQDLAYHNLSGDMTNVNYSSARIDELNERDEWQGLQEWFAAAFVHPVVTEWLESALIRGALTLANGSALPAAKLQKWRDGVTLQGRRWKWIDPEKDMNAAAKALELRLNSRTKMAAENGEDISDVFMDLAAEDSEMESLGIKPAAAKPGDTQPKNGDNKP